MFNEVFNYYGDNVIKIGKAVDIGKRMHGYTTSYMSNVEVKLISEICSDYTLSEEVIFNRLSRIGFVLIGNSLKEILSFLYKQ